MKEQLTAVFQQVPEGHIAFVEELPGANTPGDTLEDARTNLQEAGGQAASCPYFTFDKSASKLIILPSW
jgi:hypothetical protein